MISTSTYDHSFAFSQKTANQLLGDSLRSPPVPIDQRNQGTVFSDKPENLEMSVTSEVTYANHAAVINPEITFSGIEYDILRSKTMCFAGTA